MTNGCEFSSSVSDSYTCKRVTNTSVSVDAWPGRYRNRCTHINYNIQKEKLNGLVSCVT